MVLVDELNRATPKTQSGLLEAMAELQVTIEGKAHMLPRPFTVIATQNPTAGFDGTYALPPAELDRFMTRLSLGYPSARTPRPTCCTRRRRPRCRRSPTSPRPPRRSPPSAEVEARRPLLEYIVALLDATRRHPLSDAGASPRGGLMLLAAARAHAALDGRDFVVPDDVQALAGPVLAHRIQTVGGAAAEAQTGDRRGRPGGSPGAMRRGLATELLGFALLLAAALLGSIALFAFALGLLVVVAGCLAVTAIGGRRVTITRTVDQAEVVEGRPVTLRFERPRAAAGCRRTSRSAARTGGGSGSSAARPRRLHDRAPRRRT